MLKLKKAIYYLFGFSLLLLVSFMFWKNYFYDIKVRCEVVRSDGENKVQVVSYSVRPEPMLGPHIGGTARYDAIVSTDGNNKIYLSEEMSIDVYQRQRICRMSLIEGSRRLIYPVLNIFYKSQLSKKIKLLKKIDEGDTIIFDGKHWYFTKTELSDDRNTTIYYLGDQKLTSWITIEIKKYNNSLIAVQVAGLRSVIDKLDARPYMPYPAYDILDMYAYGEKVDYGKYGKFPELKPVVQRRLVSNDFGLSWKQSDWKVLDKQRVEAGSGLKKINNNDTQ